MPADARAVVAAIDDEVVALRLAGRWRDRSLAESSSLSAEARSGLRKSEASSWPRQVCSVPVQVMRTRLQDLQKLWVIGVMKPSLPPVSPTAT